ncbi:MAG: hypothetical protein GX383_08555 [Clostridium sp.]|jgi:hypothetical protein|nr:hypothetical protein [Clostridium sp.]
MPVMIIKIVLISIAVTLLAMAGRVGFAVLTVLRNIKRYAKPRIEQIDLSSMLDPDGNYYSKYNNILTSEGFEFSGDYSVITDPGIETKMRVFKNISESIEADLYQIQSKDALKMMITLITEFEDGFTIATSTNREPSMFKLKNFRIYSLPDKNLKDLILFHRQKINEESKVRKVSQEKIKKSVFENIEDSYSKQLKEQLENGILKYDSATNTYRPTLYGVLRITFKMLMFSLEEGRNKSMSDTQIMGSNKRKPFIAFFSLFGSVLIVIGLLSYIKNAESSADLYSRLLSILLGALISIIIGYILKTKKFKDS